MSWITHVKNEARKLGLSYPCALTDKRVRDSYHRRKKGIRFAEKLNVKFIDPRENRKSPLKLNPKIRKIDKLLMRRLNK